MAVLEGEWAEEDLRRGVNNLLEALQVLGSEAPLRKGRLLKDFFSKLDSDSDGSISRQEAVAFWGRNFARLNAEAMFNEVDDDANGNVNFVEWVGFWENVINNGYAEVSTLLRHLSLITYH